MRKFIAASCVFLAVCWLPAGAQQTPLADSTDLLRGVTCGEYLQTARIADPGEKPSRTRRRQAEEAQDSLVNAMLWLHGYRTGRLGADQPAPPLTEVWIIENVGALARKCQESSPDGTMTLVDAARRL